MVRKENVSPNYLFKNVGCEYGDFGLASDVSTLCAQSDAPRSYAMQGSGQGCKRRVVALKGKLMENA